MNFLVSRTDKIGDLVISLSVAKFIKRIKPESKVFYLVRKGLGDILKRAKYIDGFFEVSVGGERGDIRILEIPKLSFFLRKTRPDLCFLLYPKPILALTMKLNGVKICGTSRRFFSFLFNFRVNISRRTNFFHEAFYNLQILSPIFNQVEDISFDSIIELKPELYIEDGLCRFVKKKFSLPETYVVFHPFSGGSAPSVDIDYLYKVAQSLDIPVVWIGKNNTTLREFYGISLVNKTNIDDLLAVLKMSRCVVSPASGPIHISAALKIPTVGFYKLQEIARWMPLNEIQEIFYIENLPSPELCAKKIKDLCEINKDS
ncbi:MAG: hypothetical protein N2254_08045 [bacterium]|nr:hypothetical protein [bacterium]